MMPTLEWKWDQPDELAALLQLGHGMFCVTLLRPKNPRKGFEETDEFEYRVTWLTPSVVQAVNGSAISAANAEITSNLHTPAGPLVWVALEPVEEILRRMAIARRSL